MATEAWLITDPAAEAGSIESLPPTDGLRVMTRQELAASDLTFGPADKVAITTEAAMDETVARLDPTRQRVITTLKDKVEFRTALRPLFPELWFESIGIEQLADLRLPPDRSYIVKPAKGVFGAGVRTITGDTDLRQLQAEMADEIGRQAEVLSASALSADRLIVEQFLDGEEYAVDMFYDDAGNAVITSAYHHPMPANPAYLHMIYYLSGEVMATVVDQAAAFFRDLNRTLEARNIVLHAEFRLVAGRLVPIEINSMRVAGMGLGNMVYHTLGIDPYRHFIDDSSPDWSPLDHIPDDIVAFIAYNGATIDPAVTVPDWDALLSRFSTVVKEMRFDHRQQLAFGVLYAREPHDRLADLLAIDFDDFFVPDGN